MTMLLRSPSPPARTRAFHFVLRWRAFQALLAVLIFCNLVVFLHTRSSSADVEQDLQLQSSNLSFSSEASRNIGRVFIASLLRNNEDILKAGWSQAIVNLTQELGPDNVWVSIHESGSHDGTKRELQSLDARLTQLGAGHKISMADVEEDMQNMMPKDGPGWINVHGKHMLRRIPWLAELRNKNIEDLKELTDKNILFDRILFLNDIIFTSDDALELLRTRDGQYAAACGFDYKRPWPTITFYDQFATRDSNGQELTALQHPYFADGESRDALVRGSVVPVRSCWSGIAAFDATPFQDFRQPLRFRAINDSLAKYYVEASECCLIQYDNSLSASKGVWMNPNVRVGYGVKRYAAAHPPSGWPSTAETTMGRLSDQWTRWTQSNRQRRKEIEHRYEEWAQESLWNDEIALDCLVDKMMVVSEKGKWREV